MINNIFLILVFLPGLRFFGLIYYLFLGSSLLLTFQSIIRSKVVLNLTYLILSCIYIQQIIQLLFNFNSFFNLNSLARILIPLFLIIFFEYNITNKIKFYNLLFLANLIAIFSIFFQFLFPNFLPLPVDGTRGFITRFYSLGGNSNILGTSSALFFPFIIYSDQFVKVLNLKILKPFSVNYLRILFIIIYSLGIIITLSRGALITFIFEIGLILLLSLIRFSNNDYSFRINIKRKILRVLFYILFSISLFFLIVLVIKPSLFVFLLNLLMPIFMMFTLLGFFSQDIFWKFFPDIPLDAYSLNIFEDFLFTRVSWGLQSISQSFEGLFTLLFGVGPSAYGSIVGLEGGGGFKSFNHNNYFDLIEGQGLFGILLFVFFCFLILKRSRYWESNQKKLLIVSLSTFLLASIYSSGILHHPLWIGSLIMIPSIPIFVKVSSIKA